MIGKIDASSANAAWLKGAPIEISDISRVPYLYQQRQKLADESFMALIERTLFDKDKVPESITTLPENAKISQVAGLGSQFAMLSYPATNGTGLVLAVLSDTKNALYPGVEELINRGLWDKLQGNVFLWDKEAKFSWLQEGNTISLGEKLSLNMSGHFSNYPWQWLTLIVLVLVLVAWFIHKFLNKYQQRTHQ
jgi:hypothetical protein